MKTVGVLSYLSLLSVFDLREKKVPVILVAAGSVAVLIVRFYEGVVSDISNIDEVRLLAEIVLGMVPGIFLLVVAKITGKVGYGDGAVLLILGILDGYLMCAALLCISLFLMAMLSIGLMLLRKVCRNTKLPYLPFLTAAYVCCQLLHITS